MKRSYAIGHWLFTLIVSPFTALLLNYLTGSREGQFNDLILFYPLALVLGLIFSLPAFLIYLFCFSILKKNKINFLLSKCILIGISVLGIVSCLLMIGGMGTRQLILPYSITSVILGLVLKIGKTNSEVDNINAEEAAIIDYHLRDQNE